MTKSWRNRIRSSYDKFDWVKVQEVIKFVTVVRDGLSMVILDHGYFMKRQTKGAFSFYEKNVYLKNIKGNSSLKTVNNYWPQTYVWIY